MKNSQKLLIVFILFSFIASGTFAQSSSVSAPLDKLMEQRVKPENPQKYRTQMDRECFMELDATKPNVGKAPANFVTKSSPSAVGGLPKGLTAWAYGWDSNIFVYLDTDSPETFYQIAAFPEWDAWAADFDNVNTTFYYIINATTGQLQTVDVETGAILSTIGTPDFSGGFVLGMACDKATGIMYVSAAVSTFASSNLWIIDLTTAETTFVGETVTGDIAIDIAVDGNGDMYGFGVGFDEGFSIDKTTGAATALGPIGFDSNFGQGMAYDPHEDIIYMSAFNMDGSGGQLRIFNPENGSSTLVGGFPDGEQTDAFAFPGSLVSYDTDLGIQYIMEPNSGVDLTASEPVTIRIRNFGTTPQFYFDVSFTLDGGTTITETITTALFAGETHDHTFTTPVDLSAYGSYVVEVCVMLTGDENPDNDCKTKTVENLEPFLCFPYFNGGCALGDGFTDFAVEEIQNFGNACDDNTGLSGCSQYFDLGPAILGPGDTHTFTMGSGYHNQHVNIWIDFNDNLILEADEMILTDYIIAAPNVLYDVDITIPEDATQGLHIMRALANFNITFTDPCGSYSYGESEDYMVLVSDLGFGHITGNVILDGPAPYNVADVTDVLVSSGGYSTNPDASGNYDLEVYPGTYDVMAALFGYSQQISSGITVAEGATVSGIDFTLPCLLGIVEGTVTDLDDGTPIEGAIVEAVGTGISATTAADGTYSILIESGNYDFQVWAPLYAYQTVNLDVTELTTATQDFALEASEGVIVIIDLNLTPTGTGLVSIIEELFPDGEVVYTTTIDGYPLDGSVRSVFLMLGIFNFVFTEAEATVINTWMDTYPDRSIYFEGGDTWAWNPSTTSLHSRFNINGLSDGTADMVTANGIASFWAGHSWGYSGFYNIDHIEAIAPAVNVLENTDVGYYTAVAYDEGSYKTVGASHEILSLTGGAGTTMAVKAVMGFFGYPVFTYGDLEGYVTENLSGDPVEGAEVTVAGVTGTSDASGYYFLEDVITGTWEATASKANYHPETMNITIDEDALTVQDFQLVAPGMLQGTVTDLASGDPIEDAMIEVGGLYTSITGADGMYMIEEVLTGTHDVYCTKDGYNTEMASVTIDEGQTETQDFAMVIPEIVIDPLVITEVLEIGETTDVQVNISNPGLGTLNWSAQIVISEEDKGNEGSSKDAIASEEALNSGLIATGKPMAFEKIKHLNIPLQKTMSGEKDDTDIIGGMGMSWTSGPRTRGNLFTCTEEKILVEFMNYMTVISDPTQMWMLVYEGESQVGTYDLVVASDVSPAPVGEGWVSSGEIDYLLTPGKYYMMVASFEQECVYYADTEVTPFPYPVAFGDATGQAGVFWSPTTSFPPEPTHDIPVAVFDAPILYYQQLVTTSTQTWLSIDPESGSVGSMGNEDMTVHLGAMELTIPGIYEAEIHFSSTPDVGSPVVNVTLTVVDLVSAVNLTGSYDCTDVMLTWEMPTGANPDSWNIYRDGTLLGNANAMEYTDVMVMPDIEYIYTVKAVYSGVESMQTPDFMIIVPTPGNLEPLNPEALPDVPNYGDITINWDAPDACLAPDGYDVYRDGNQINANLVTELTYVDPALDPGLYEYKIKAVYYFGESDFSNPANALIVGIEDVSADQFQIFPNPASDLLNVKSPIEVSTIRILNNSGQSVMVIEVNAVNHQIDVSQLESGIYYIRLETEEGHKLQKIAIQ